VWALVDFASRHRGSSAKAGGPKLYGGLHDLNMVAATVGGRRSRSSAKTGAVIAGHYRDVSELSGPNDREIWQGLNAPMGRTFRRTSAASDAHSAPADLTSSGASFVTMVQAADFSEYDYVTSATPCTRRGVGASFANDRCVRDPYSTQNSRRGHGAYAARRAPRRGSGSRA
jgi:hypothetical protein